ncbi:NADAR family protein [Flavobacterium sp.]|uniref:NADAR family protein n=1 Tax=Flavobacterium sp. TaxID=239 RepID=UPI003452EA11
MKYSNAWLIDRYENGDSLKFIYFWGNTDKMDLVTKACFSQWYDSPFSVNNHTYLTAEHWMMAQKALLFNDQNSHDNILNAVKAGEVKEIGRQINNFNQDEWDKRKREIVRVGNIHKFNQHKNLAEFLLNTKERILVESSPVDTVWGVGLSQDNPDIENLYLWRGENLLGYALMEARDFLSDFGHFTSDIDLPTLPWLKYPNVERSDMFWRMGFGEDYWHDFKNEYMKLDERQKTIYQLNQIAPPGWEDFL